jgi:hypothetical protein
VGLTVVPASGAIAVLHDQGGLFELVDGELVSIADPTALERDGADLRPYTDVVAMGDGLFAVTVKNDGLLLDVDAGVTTQHFCYLPGEELESDPVREELTHSVAYDAETDTLLAQPQTWVDGVLTSAQVGTYSGRRGGQPEGWFTLKDERFAAHAMVSDGPRTVKLARGGVLYTYDYGDRKPEPFADLTGLGVMDIEGMAVRDDDTLVVVDGGRVLEITGWRP